MFYINTLSIAGSDCSGGAGIQADIKTMSALGCYASSVVTSVTVQNTKGVKDIFTLPPYIISEQIDAVMSDLDIKSVKIGMINDIDSINAIADSLKKYIGIKIVCDPVMVSSHGQRLMDAEALNLFVHKIIPLSFILTPNIPETEVLTNISINSFDDITNAAEKILDMGCSNVLIKGGHSEMGNDDIKTDYLFFRDEDNTLYHRRFSSPNVNTRNTHGTGCTLSSAISVFLAQENDVISSVAKAKTYVYNALNEGRDVIVGDGIGPMNHFFNPIKTIKRSQI